MDMMPDFTAMQLGPVAETVVDGACSSPNTWAGGIMPESGYVVRIHHDVEMDCDDLDVHTIGVMRGGRLWLPDDRDVRLELVTLQVHPGGELDMGTADRPLRGEVEVVWKDVPIDDALDPGQWSNGLLVMGKARVHGLPHSASGIMLAEDAHAGDIELRLSAAPAGWREGDTVIVPDTRQVMPRHRKQFARERGVTAMGLQIEERTVVSIDGATVVLDAPLEFDHLGARDAMGDPTGDRAHAIRISRNVTFRSQNPDGTRGHALAAHRADVDFRYAAWVSMGRTRNAATDPATNPAGRYSLHAHHLLGPKRLADRGYQFVWVGNAAVDALRWAYTVHASSWGLLYDNVAYRGEGAGFVTEDGTERGNLFLANFSIGFFGTNDDGNVGRLRFETNHYGNGGVGFWLRRGPINSVVGNVAANNLYAGYVSTNYYNTSERDRLPAYRGAARDTVDISEVPVAAWGNNTGYGMTRQGLWGAHLGFDASWQTWVAIDTTFWNVHEKVLLMYHTEGTTFVNLRIFGDRRAFLGGADYSSPPSSRQHPPVGLQLEGPYEAVRFRMLGGTIQGMYAGVQPTKRDGSHLNPSDAMLLADVHFENYTNFYVRPSENSTGGTPPRRVILVRPRLEIMDVPGDGDTAWRHRSIVMDYTPAGRRSIMVPNEFLVLADTVDGSSYRVFPQEAAPDFVVPLSEPGRPASPVPGLTNAQTWYRYGIAIGGRPAWCTATRNDVHGLVCPVGS